MGEMSRDFKFQIILLVQTHCIYAPFGANTAEQYLIGDGFGLFVYCEKFEDTTLKTVLLIA